jgi:hypothetical protein
MNADGTNVRLLTKSTCDVHYTRPVWLDDQTIVLIWERQPGGWYDRRARHLGQTGEVLERSRRASSRTASVTRDAGQVIYERGRIVAFDVVAGRPRPCQAAGSSAGTCADGSLELSI